MDKLKLKHRLVDTFHESMGNSVLIELDREELTTIIYMLSDVVKREDALDVISRRMSRYAIVHYDNSGNIHHYECPCCHQWISNNWEDEE